MEKAKLEWILNIGIGNTKELKYSVVDFCFPSRKQGYLANLFVSTIHTIILGELELAIHFLRLSEWEFLKFEGRTKRDPERHYKNAWRLVLAAVVIDWVDSRNRDF